MGSILVFVKQELIKQVKSKLIFILVPMALE